MGRLRRSLAAAAVVLAMLMPAGRPSWAPVGDTVPLPRPARAALLPDCDPGERMVLVPVAGHAYHTAYFSASGRETAYTDEAIVSWREMTGRRVAGIYLSDHWGDADGDVRITFPQAKVQMFWRHGALPMVRMMPWSKLWTGGADPKISMQAVARGRFDDQLRAWFRDARDTGIPLLLEFGVEVNGDWFPWNGRWNGGGTTDGYGSPERPDGPERFRDAYRHVVDLSRATGAARLITWNFHVNADSWPQRWWNQPRWYYPGDSYVDWLSVSNYGEQVPSGKPSHWAMFGEDLGSASDPSSSYSRIRRLDPPAPFAVIEFGVTEDPAAGDKAGWITDAYSKLVPPTAVYDASLVSYWSEKWRNGNGKVSDLRVDSSPEALAAYREAIADPFLVTTPEFACV
jgi:hypothetical protein